MLQLQTSTSLCHLHRTMSQRVAVVSGSNKGIGLAIVRGLFKIFDGDVILTARDVSRGEKAVQDLVQEGRHPKFHQLDVNDKDSIRALKTYLLQNYGGLDILVNNVGIFLGSAHDGWSSDGESAASTLKTNYWSLKDVCDALFPILRPHARVVNMSSMVTRIQPRMCKPFVTEKIMSANSIEAIDELATEYERYSVDGTLVSNGWAAYAYGISKSLVRLLTNVQQRNMDTDSHEDVIINCCCPGYVATDINQHSGLLTTDEGADTPVYLATLPPGISSPKGEYVFRRKIEQWQ